MVKKTLQKLFTVLALSTAALSAHAQETLIVGASPTPHAEILRFIAPALKEEGIELKVVEFTDYVLPNLATAEKKLDANYFQHKPYLDTFNANRQTNIAAVPNSEVHVEPFGAYSNRINTIAELKNGATVAIPNDPSNTGRALRLLHEGGLIELKDPQNILATARDIINNPKNLKFRELESAQVPRALDDVDLALINSNYALEAGLTPTVDALILDGSGSIYANFIATRADQIDDPKIQKLARALRTAEVKEFMNQKYKGAVIAAFE